MKKIRLFLIEDDQLLRVGLMEILSRQKDMTVVAAAGTAENSFRKVHNVEPNVVLMDLSMRHKNSISVIQAVKKEYPNARVILMDMAPVPSDILRFVNAGASGFMVREITVQLFLQTIRAVAEGVKLIPPLMPDSLFATIVRYALKAAKKKKKSALTGATTKKRIATLKAMRRT